MRTQGNHTVYGLEQLINEPTRTTQTSSTLIDLVLTSHLEKITKSGLVQLGLSDHDLIRKINTVAPDAMELTTTTMRFH